MAENMDRREFLKMSGGASAGALLANFTTDPSLFAQTRPGGKAVRVGVIGTGNRGRSLLANLLLMPGLEFPALCDIDLDALATLEKILSDPGFRRAKEKFHGMVTHVSDSLLVSI